MTWCGKRLKPRRRVMTAMLAMASLALAAVRAALPAVAVNALVAGAVRAAATGAEAADLVDEAGVIMPAVVSAATRPGPVGPTPPSPLVQAVTARLSGDWKVATERLALQWGPAAWLVRGGEAPEVRLVGRGDEGRFVVVVDPRGARPRSIRLRAGVIDSVAVAARALPRGTRLTDGDMAWQRTVSWGPPRPPAAKPGSGWEVRRALAAGEELTSGRVAPPIVVRPGEPVSLTWTRGDVSIAVVGVALNAARVGETVRVRVDGRLEPVEGEATEPGLARLMEGVVR